MAALLSLALVSAACGGGGTEEGTGGGGGGGNGSGGGGGTITIGYIPWDEDIAVSYMWQNLLEAQGYTVELQQLEAGPLFQGVASGDLDLFLDVWLPTTHETYWNQYGDQVETITEWYDNASLEWTVPSYVENINSIADLPGNADMFGGQVVGIEAGAGLTEASTESVIPDYGLEGEYTLATSSTPAMLAELERSISAQEPVLVTLWHPHWAYSAYDLKDLEDPQGSLGEAETLSAIGRQGFSTDFPDVNQWMSNWTMTDEQLAGLENEIRNAGEGNEAQGVQTWLDNNQEFVSSLGIS